MKKIYLLIFPIMILSCGGYKNPVSDDKLDISTLISIPDTAVFPSPFKTPTKIRITSTTRQTSAPVLPTKTETPSPIAPTDKARAHVFNLLETNAGCKLPCWWGITPGISSKQQLHNLFVTLTNATFNRPIKPEAISFSLPQIDDTILRLDIYSSSDNLLDKIDGLAIFMNVDYKKEKPKKHTLETMKHLRNFQLSQILTDYGSPEEILLYVFDHAPTIDIYLYYPQHGFSIEYEMVGQTGDEVYVVCPAIEYIQNVQLTLVDPQNGYKVSEGVIWIEHWQNPFEVYTSIDQVTYLTVESFSNKYKNPAETACFYTPRSFWEKHELWNKNLPP